MKITISIPPQRVLQDVKNQLVQEYAMAEKIKNREVSNKITDALKRIDQFLSKFPVTPVKGMRIEATEDYLFINIPNTKEIEVSQYRCDPYED